ncbi:MAG: hypothetical protein ACLRRN_00885 [Oscillospiraceae bacterium]
MKHKASWILAIVLVIAGCVLRFAMPGHDFLGYTLWGIAVLVLSVGAAAPRGAHCAERARVRGADRVRGL